ncbi:hypothetical protein CapIbe_015989 [Capra ibex]
MEPRITQPRPGARCQPRSAAPKPHSPKPEASLPEKKEERASSLIALAASHPFIWLSLEPRPRLFCGRDWREPRQFPSRCDVAKD